VICPSCGAENRSDGKFCFECGTPLASACAACGTSLRPGARFCDECGTPVGPAARPAGDHASAPGPSSERRLVSVLFADLVGFTSLSESRDAEEVRELLSRYFDASRTLITRYGGTVEKFIGDAVMAVWGTPVAQEDDVERAVRAALDLVDAVAALGQEVGAPDLNARAGVLTGEAAVTIGAEGQGMVAGDLVNTASRIQGAAPPGQVYCGEATRRSSEAAIVYEDAGTHELKGKAEPLRLWRALRVVAAVGGVQRSAGLEPPFVGRDRELRLLKDLFHATAEGSKAHMVSVTGAAGVGKSRLTWEFEKYVDGLAGQFRWHRGRCLAYGEGVTYWALAEMVRTRARIVEGEDSQSALAKLREALEKSLPDPEERRWVEPRLAHLLGLEERVTREREDLFAAWRLFYERLADEMPTVMVFEDCQWADSALLDFIEYLLEWARDHRLFVITLARPEFADRRPNWGTGRSSTSMYLEPLPPQAMDELLTGLVPGLPAELHNQILGRAEGIPLYAVETVRMLLDRGLLVEEGNSYRPTGRIEALEVPETLHALIAARLDGLAAEERRLLQDASVLGKTFTKGAIAAVSGLAEAHLESVLTLLTRKEVLTVQADPRSPERGQYGFVQDLLRHVAYETLSKKDRRARHLVVAEYLEENWAADEEEIVEVVASHYVNAYQAAPEADDAAAIKAKAREMLARAGKRAASLAANEEAQHYFEQAAALAEEPSDEAPLLEWAGQMAWLGGRAEEARPRLERAMSLFESAGLSHPAARVSARLGEVEWRGGSLDQAIARMEAAFQVLSEEEPDEDLGALAAQLGRLQFMRGKPDLAERRIEIAVATAESLWLPEVLSGALVTEGIVAMNRGRFEKALALVKHGLDVALENDLPSAAVRAYANLAEFLCRRDRHEEAIEQYRRAVVLARRAGNRIQEWVSLANMAYPLWLTGRWDEAEEAAGEIPLADWSGGTTGSLMWLVSVRLHRGDAAGARELLEVFRQLEEAEDIQDRTGFAQTAGTMLRAEGDPVGALCLAEEAFQARETLGIAAEDVKAGFIQAVECAFDLGDTAKVDDLLAVVEELKPGVYPPFLRANVGRFRARLAAARGESESAEAGLKMAAGMFRELGMPFYLAVTLLEHGEWLDGQGRTEEATPLLAEAGGIFERLGARPWIERVDRVRVPEVVGGGSS
jgi:class 3 adenylate cyclase/tetratricopeptide (TPR) repeat protein